mmetsp:Transcript_16113/g.13639  ORF Transcript_16113/g.13639 Transcript_16113/m.13639 type:complete len:234 (-) Transcript_16113:723-1424(-)
MSSSSSSSKKSAPSHSVKVEGILCKSKHTIYKARHTSENRHFAMKVFFYEKDQPSESFNNESRLLSLDHPNIIKAYESKKDQKFQKDGKLTHASYLLMELAPFGDFGDLVQKISFTDDEKLVRTYFHQLIGGIEYLHSIGVAHLDIKNDNLLLSDDYSLKISDFDFCFKIGDKFINGRGTRNFRAPEIKEGEVKYADMSDIYSAGIVLFILRFGCFPYAEDQKTAGYNLQNLL